MRLKISGQHLAILYHADMYFTMKPVCLPVKQRSNSDIPYYIQSRSRRPVWHLP